MTANSSSAVPAPDDDAARREACALLAPVYLFEDEAAFLSDETYDAIEKNNLIWKEQGCSQFEAE